MNTAVTLEDVWALFAEVARQSQETDRRFRESRQEMDRQLRESRQELDRQLQESRQEMDRQLQEFRYENERQFQELRREMQYQFQEVAQQVKEISVQLGNLGNRLGEFVEEQVMPGALKLIQERGIAVHEIYRRAKVKRAGREAEVDLLLVNDQDVVAVEVKSALNLKHIDQHLKRLNNFRELFRHYAEFRIYGAVAGMVVPEESISYAIEHGLFVLVPAAGIMQLVNDDLFQPHMW